MVCKERNFTRAADRLAIAQPPLSRAIQQLEEELGTVLIDREHRPFRLTDAGQIFFEQATQLLDRFDNLREMMRRFGERQSTRFTIGFVASTMYAALPDLIRRFRTVTPGLNLQLVEMMSAQQVAALKDGRIDVGFGRLRFDDPQVRRDVLREEPLVVALPLSHPMLKREGPLSLAALADEPLIVYPSTPRPSYADHVISLYQDRGLKPLIAYEASELQTAIGLVAAEVGVCIVPTSVQRLRRDDVAYRGLDQPNLTSPIIMSRRADDRSREIVLLARVIIDAYTQWGWPAPEGLDR